MDSIFDREARFKGGRNAAHLKIIDIARQVLQEIDAKEKWKALLNCSDPKVIVEVMKYLTDRVHGRTTDDPGQSGTTRHDSIGMVLHAGMAAAEHNAESGSHRHINHINRSRRGDATTHRRANASLK